MTPTEAAAILSELEGIALPVLDALVPGPAREVVELAINAAIASLRAIDKAPEPAFVDKLQASVDADVRAKFGGDDVRPGPGGMGDGDKPAGEGR